MTTELSIERTSSEKFTGMILREFAATVGQGFEMTQYQRQLAQHLFIKIDSSLKDLEVKRQGDPKKVNNSPISWANSNLNKMAIDAIHKINIGLDALIDNHLHVIPYWSTRDKKYNIDLRVGYVGKDYYKRKYALDPPADILYELVYTTDKFTPIMRSTNTDIETYHFEVTKPFDRGEVVGGFGYLIYDNPTKNKLIFVQMKRIKQAENKGNKTFWTDSREQMQWKTIVTAVTNKINPDPQKVNDSYFIVESQDNEDQVQADIDENANKEVIEVEKEQGSPEIDEVVDVSEAVEVSPGF